jgi:alkylation response protein AidB-like acyl-CoA dehydrogenase
LSLGIADAALAALLDHARHRTIPSSGTPLSDLQWVRFGLADVHTRIEAAGMYNQHMCWLADENSPEFLNATLRAKLLANEIAKDTAQLGVQVGGGSGYLRSSPIQRHFRDAQAGALMAYSAEICKETLGRGLAEGTSDG